MHQPVSNHAAALRLAALDGSNRPAEKPRRLLMRAAFQVAEHERRAIFLRQPVHLFVDHRIKIEFAMCHELYGATRMLRRASLLVLAPSNGGRPEARRRATGDLMEPGTQRVSHPERSSLAEEDEKRGLEGIFRVVLVADDGQADAPDHRFVPLDERRESQLGQLVSVRCEPFQELAVGQLSDGSKIVEGSELPMDGPFPSSDDHSVCPHPAIRLRSRRPDIDRFTIMSPGARMVLNTRDILGSRNQTRALDMQP